MTVAESAEEGLKLNSIQKNELTQSIQVEFKHRDTKSVSVQYN